MNPLQLLIFSNPPFWRQFDMFLFFLFFFQSPPTTPINSPATSSSAYQEQSRRFYGSDRPPMSLKSAPPLSPGRRSDPSSSSSSSYVSRTTVGLHNSGSSTLLSTWNGGGSSLSVDGGGGSLLSVPAPSSRTPSAGGAVSMPSSPRLGRRSYANQEPPAPSSSRTRKYSAGSLSSMTAGGHSRSLPRLCPSPSPRDNGGGGLVLTTLPPRRSDVAGGYKYSKDFYSNYQSPAPDLSHKTQSLNSSQGEGVLSICLSSPKTTPTSVPPNNAPPDVTIPSRQGGSSSPRVAKKLSLTSTTSVSSVSSSSPESEQLAGRGLPPGTELYSEERERRGVGQEVNGTLPRLGQGERRSSFGKAGLEHGLGLGERRQSFGKAGVTPPGGFRERRGSISSLSGKEELTDYHQRQKEERLREQEVERLVSWRWGEIRTEPCGGQCGGGTLQ